ncbi:ammonium transporter [Aeromicrobium halocynthiae]|uniref:Ammonium transporter n=1 Tax=Aeromicrobium halocynthiae TaxID=560557 RepID=A0ABN2W0K3_9ACTN
MSIYVAWTLVCAALVILMTPGLAFFYGGLVKSKSVVSMMMLSFGSIVVVAILYVLYGASQIGSEGGGYFGNPLDDFGLSGVAESANGAAFEATEVAQLFEGGSFADHAFLVAFCIITVALVSGAVADRARFWPWMLFAALFATLVVFPTFRWLWGGSGWLAEDVFGLGGAYDWAGGTIIHQSAGAAALALALVLGRRKAGFSKEEAAPHNVPLVLIGAAILWFGWFGFNTGVYGSNLDQTGLIFLNTLITPAAAALGYIAVETFKDGKATAVGAASGIVAGLVAITPACAFVTPVWAIVLGIVAGSICAFAIDLKYKLGYDDSLDVVGLHLVAGFIGCLYVGLFASVEVEGLFMGGGATLFGAQLVSSLFVIAFSFIVTYVIGTAIEKTIGFRATEEDEIAGIDIVLHGEGYALD